MSWIDRLKGPQGQMSEAFITIMFLTLSGGMQDAYTYCIRGEVFANAQTGNIVLMSHYLFQGDWKNAVLYFISLAAFASGICVAEYMRQRCQNHFGMHWRQLVVLWEMALLFSVGFIPHSVDFMANAIVSFACAMQVQAFRKVSGNAYASTMCIGNLRSCMGALCEYHFTGNPAMLKKSMQYLLMISIFAIGAGAGALLTLRFGEKAIWACCVLLMVSFSIMFIKGEE